jgi:tripartite-type tricarboxylate transporter receptor subunit TctC
MQRHFRNLTRAFALVATAAATLALSAPEARAQAQTYPDRPVRMIVAFEPGGATDLLARLICQELTTALGQTFFVENKSGGGGNIGANMVAKAAPDGYTLHFGAAGNIAINPSLFSNMPYDPQTDFAPVAPMASTMNILVVNPAVPAKTVAEVIALAKEKPGKLTFASSGNGGTIHLSGEMFKVMAKVDIVHVPYRGSGPAMIDLIAGRTDMMFDNLPSALPRVQNGSLRAIAVTAAKRSKALPDVPTIAEAGLPGYEATTWFGVFAPAQTPPAIVDKLNRAIADALRKPAVVEKIAGMGAEPMFMTPDEFKKLVKTDTDKWRIVVKQANVKLD